MCLSGVYLSASLLPYSLLAACLTWRCRLPHVLTHWLPQLAFTYANPQAHLQTFRQFLAPFPILDLNEPIMERFAEIRSHLCRRGEIIPDFDILIGATALYLGLTVLT